MTALVLLGALALLNANDGFDGTSAATAFGWLVPLGAVVLTGVLAASLYSIRSPGPSEHEGFGVCRCSQCGGTVLGEWRLCPHCGTALGDADSAADCRLV